MYINQFLKKIVFVVIGIIWALPASFYVLQAMSHNKHLVPVSSQTPFTFSKWTAISRIYGSGLIRIAKLCYNY